MATLVQHIEIDPSWPKTGYDRRGRRVRLIDVELLYPPGGERDDIYFIDKATKRKVYPWRDVGTYYEDDGTPTQIVFDSVAELVAATTNAPVQRDAPGEMSRRYLESLGGSDADLEQQHQRIFGLPAAIVAEGEDPDAPAVRRRRRQVFDSILAHDFG
jgi:hypothetical protein